MYPKEWYYADEHDNAVGPVSATTIQELLDAGLLTGETLVWAPSMPNWASVRDVDEFEVPRPVLRSLPTPIAATGAGSSDLTITPQVASIEPVAVDESAEPRPWRRLFARWVDYSIFSFVLGIIFVLNDPAFFRQDGTNQAFGILAVFLWIPVEVILLSTIGTTPGKALLRLRVRRANGEKLNLGEALGRSLTVWFLGLGMGLPCISVIMLLWSWRRLDDKGQTRWDQEGGYIVTSRPLGALRAIFVVFLLIGIFGLALLGNMPQ